MTMTIEQLRKRNAELIAAERERAGDKTTFWYLSYSGESVFNGGVIVRAFGFVHACQRARDLRINPGGEIMGLPIPADRVPAGKYLDKLLTLADLLEIWPDMERLSNLEAEQ